MPHPLVLVADDDPAFREALPETLRYRLPGIAVETCPSTEIAVSYMELTEYDAVITDVQMPGDGLSLLSTVRRKWPQTPVLVLTAYGNDAVMRAATELGAFALLDKPIEREQLTAVVASAIEVHRLQRECGKLERELSLLAAMGGRALSMRAALHHDVLVLARQDLERRLDETRMKLQQVKSAMGQLPQVA